LTADVSARPLKGCVAVGANVSGTREIQAVAGRQVGAVSGGNTGAIAQQAISDDLQVPGSN